MKHTRSIIAMCRCVAVCVPLLFLKTLILDSDFIVSLRFLFCCTETVTVRRYLHFITRYLLLTLLASQTESVTVMTVVTAMIRANFQYHCRVHRITV